VCVCQVCSSLVHLSKLVTVEDLEQLGSLLTDKYDILAVHLTKYISSAGEQAEQGLRNVNPLIIVHCLQCLDTVGWTSTRPVKIE